MKTAVHATVRSSFRSPRIERGPIRFPKTFGTYFTTIAHAKSTFIESVQKDKFEHVANVAAVLPVAPEPEEEPA